MCSANSTVATPTYVTTFGYAFLCSSHPVICSLPLSCYSRPPQDARTLLMLKNLLCVRSMTSSFMLLAHLVALTESIGRAGLRYRDTIRRGTQPPLSG